MNKKLFFQAIFKVILGLAIVGLLLFFPAYSFNYYQAWILIGLLFIPMFIVGVILMIKDPERLKKRLNAKETEKDQKEVIIISAIMFILGFIIAGLNYKFKWNSIPENVWIGSIVLFILSYIMYGEVIRENAYLSRVIEVSNNQKVVDTGLYSIVRHPMYLATIVLFLTMPLILNSIYSFIIFLIYPLVIMKRIKNEEDVLEKNLPGYIEYKQKVKYKLIPFIW